MSGSTLWPRRSKVKSKLTSGRAIRRAATSSRLRPEPSPPTLPRVTRLSSGRQLSALTASWTVPTGRADRSTDWVELSYSCPSGRVTVYFTVTWGFSLAQAAISS